MSIFGDFCCSVYGNAQHVAEEVKAALTELWFLYLQV